MKRLLLARRMLLLNSQTGESAAEENLITPVEFRVDSDGSVRLNKLVGYATQDIASGTVCRITGNISCVGENTSTGYGNIYFRGAYGPFSSKQIFRRIISPSITYEYNDEFDMELTAAKDIVTGEGIINIDIGKLLVGYVQVTNMKLVKV